MIRRIVARAAYMFCLFWLPSLVILLPALALLLAGALALSFRPLFCVREMMLYGN